MNRRYFLASASTVASLAAPTLAAAAMQPGGDLTIDPAMASPALMSEAANPSFGYDNIRTMTLLVFDKKNANDRTYSANQVSYRKSGMIVGDETGVSAGSIIVDKIVGRYDNARVEGDRLVADVRLYNTPAAALVHDLIHDMSFQLSASSVGEVDDHGRVTDCDLIGAYVVRQNAWNAA